MILVPSVGIGDRDGWGRLSLVEPKLFYYACNYTLQVGDDIDYSYFASDTVVFEVTWVPKVPRNPIPAPGIDKVRQEGTSGHGMLTADADGVYTVWFYNPDDTTMTPVVVSYLIHSHESSSVEWGLVLAVIAGVVIAGSAAGAALIMSAKRKGV